VANSDADNQAFGLSLPGVDEGTGADASPFELLPIIFCGVLGVDVGFWEKGASAWGVSRSTTTCVAEFNMKTLDDK